MIRRYTTPKRGAPVKKISLRKYARLQQVMRFSHMPERHMTIRHELAVVILEKAKGVGRFFIAPLRAMSRR